jgi:hypothetical protein
MDEIHVLHRYGKYSFGDVMGMTTRERNALLDRLNDSMKREQAALRAASKR